uniref:Uncharacterized protein n=1 Tax=Octopus bimaculoides TaxID=37653 RepID=A0A0L8FKY3_OCTBM
MSVGAIPLFLSSWTKFKELKYCLSVSSKETLMDPRENSDLYDGGTVSVSTGASRSTTGASSESVSTSDRSMPQQSPSTSSKESAGSPSKSLCSSTSTSSENVPAATTVNVAHSAVLSTSEPATVK